MKYACKCCIIVNHVIRQGDSGGYIWKGGVHLHYNHVHSIYQYIVVGVILQ